MPRSSLIAILLFSALLHMSTASIPSLGRATAQNVRSKLRDIDFVIRGNVPPITGNNGFSSITADATNKKVLSATDTQFRISTVHVASGRPFVKHYHPRGAEVLYVTRGIMVSYLWDEGNKARVIRNVVRKGDSTVFPQGLVHLVRCISKIDCTFVGVLNSGDPGTVPVAAA